MLSMKRLVTGSGGLMLTLALAGCEPQHPKEVPSEAQMVVEGDREIAYTTPDRGMLYVYDQNSQKLVWTGEVDKGKTLKIDRRTQDITVGDKLLVTKIDPYHNEQVYFVPDSGSGLASPAPTVSTYSDYNTTPPTAAPSTR
jgi:hypothetical protein